MPHHDSPKQEIQVLLQQSLSLLSASPPAFMHNRVRVWRLFLPASVMLVLLSFFRSLSLSLSCLHIM